MFKLFKVQHNTRFFFPSFSSSHSVFHSYIILVQSFVIVILFARVDNRAFLYLVQVYPVGLAAHELFKSIIAFRDELIESSLLSVMARVSPIISSVGFPYVVRLILSLPQVVYSAF